MGAEQRLRGHVAQADDHPGRDDSELAEQKGSAGGNFVFFRSSILGRPALNHIADIDVVAAQAHGLDHLREQLSRAAYERDALDIFVVPWTLADEDQFGFRIANSKDNISAMLVESAASAIADVLANAFKRIALNSLGRFKQ